MRISLVGGMNRLETHYRAEALKRGFDLKVFNSPETNMSAKIAGSEAVVLFTGKVSHEARKHAMAAAKSSDIPVIMCHSSGICAFRDCIDCIAATGKKQRAS
jgi:hypothetical protein